MFTGIIQEVGLISNVERLGGGIRITVAAPESAIELSVDDSVSINGVCQTVIARNGSEFTVEAVEETLAKTTLGQLAVRSPVNLELPMRLNDRLGGHLVLGHVDGVGVIQAIEKKETSWLYTLEIPSRFLRYVIPVGSIAVDGVSLTIAKLHGNTIVLSIIPHTFENTTFRVLRVGMSVNLEFDILGKYIERLLLAQTEGGPDEGLTASKLEAWGYTL